MRTFFIYPNLRKQSAREILPSVCEQLRGREIRLILPNQMRGTMHALHDEVMALDYMDTAEAVPHRGRRCRSGRRRHHAAHRPGGGAE